MASIILKNINKIYPNNVHAVFDFNLEISDKELIVFVGPSGCGKSTTLRMIAGLEDISSGELQIDNKLVNYTPPKDRNVAMVFQNYALYPHMSVYSNMAYGIKIRSSYQPLYEKNDEIDNLLRELRTKKDALSKIERKMAKKGDDQELKDQYDEIFKEIQKVLKKIMELRKPIIGIDEKRIKRIKTRIGKMQKELEYVSSLYEKEEASEEKDEEFSTILKQDIDNVNSVIKDLNEELADIQSHETEILRNRHMYSYEIDYEVYHAAEILDLSRYLFRKPNALSGGQRQRVALGRAIVRKPRVFLMDEPLSNLDAKLRVQTRTEIAKIHKRVGATTIYVTHDQTEAMTLADRIVIMKDGYVQQIGAPMECFNDPNNMFVGGFIGSPSMNFFNGVYKDGRFTAKDDDEVLFSIKIDKKYQGILKGYDGDEIVMGVRPENIHFESDFKKEGIDLAITSVELLGSEFILYSKTNSLNIAIKTNFYMKEDELVKRHFAFDDDCLYFFDKTTTNRIR